MTYKRFTLLIIALYVIAFVGNVYLWNTQTRTILENEKTYMHGDLARLGYFKATPALTHQKDIPVHKYMEFDEYIRNERVKQSVDILTIGDSFFNGGAGYYFQDVIASNYKYNVLNIKCMEGYEALEMLASLVNSGYIDIISPKVVIVESVGRYCIDRYGKKLDFDNTKYQLSKENITRYYKTSSIKEDSINSFLDPRMPEFNIKYIKSLLNLLNNTGKLNEFVQYEKLKAPLFTNSGQEKMLLYYSEDTNNIARVNRQSIKLLNDNLNKMSSELYKRKVQFVFIPAVDKYDLYFDFIESNNKNINPLFIYLRELEKNYIFVDTKSILQQALVEGETDIYWLDDTHWSWKGQNIVAHALFAQLKF